MQRRGLQALDFFEEVNETYGVDEEIVSSEDDYTVRIPDNTLSLSDRQLSELRAAVDPLSDSETFGIELYIETLEFLRSLL